MVIVVGGFSLFSKEDTRQFASTLTPPPLTKETPETRKVKRKKSESQLNNISETQYEQSLENLKRESEKDPKNPLLYEQMGDLFFLKKDFSLAGQSYEIAALLDAKNMTRQVKYVRSLLARRKVIEAERVLLTLDANDESVLLYRGIVSAFLNKPKDSKVALSKISQSTNPSLAQQALVVLNAYTTYESATDAQPVYLQALLSRAFNELGEYELSIALGLEAIKQKTDYRDVWLVIGHSYLSQNMWNDAESALLKAVSLDATQSLAHVLLGFTEESLVKPMEAATHFKKALDLGYEPAFEIAQKRADNLYEAGVFDEALTAYTDLINKNSAQLKPEAYIRPMVIYIERQNEPERALELARVLVDTHPDDATAINLFGWALLSVGEDGAAEDALNSALARDEKLPAAHLNLGKLSQRRGDLSQALEYYRNAYTYGTERNDISITNAAAALYNAIAKTIN